jgi:hypothetical protein
MYSNTPITPAACTSAKIRILISFKCSTKGGIVEDWGFLVPLVDILTKESVTVETHCPLCYYNHSIKIRFGPACEVEAVEQRKIEV